MSKVKIKPFNVVDSKELPEMMVDRIPVDGDPVEIDGEIYYVCEKKSADEGEFQQVGVIPLVVRNPSKVQNIKSYIECLSIAHRRFQFKKGNKTCDLEDCDEMIISE